jgi:hypothetical protein
MGMKFWMAATFLGILDLCGCGRPVQNNAQSNELVATPVANEAAPAPSENAQANVSLPGDRVPLEEPKAPIDPKSAEAAGQVVQHYGALIEQRRWTESWTLWSNADAARQFDRNWRDDSEVHMEIGKAGDTEGAAGSIYTTVPVVFYGKTNAGGSFRHGADVILRRVNDVPGSTEAQRRWHIERIELKLAR